MTPKGFFTAFPLSLLLPVIFCGSGHCQTQQRKSRESNNYRHTVFLENQKLGENTWYLSKANVGHTIEVFASATSVNRGGTIKLYVNTTQPASTMNTYRMGCYRGAGAGNFFGGLWEFNMVRFLEREGYDVTYSTDLDTHENGSDLLNHKAFIIVGHDEYWSWQMRDNVEAARGMGINLGFFSANTAY